MKSDDVFVPLTGGCKCGAVRFRMEAAPMITHCCHCRSCQRISGSAFGINAMVERDRLTMLEGTPEPFLGPDDGRMLRCPACRSTLWAYHRHFGEAVAFVGVGMLDEGERLAPEAHYFIRSKHPWIVLPADIPAFDELGDPGKPGLRERVMAALASPAALPDRSDRAPD